MMLLGDECLYNVFYWHTFYPHKAPTNGNIFIKLRINSIGKKNRRTQARYYSPSREIPKIDDPFSYIWTKKNCWKMKFAWSNGNNLLEVIFIRFSTSINQFSVPNKFFILFADDYDTPRYIRISRISSLYSNSISLVFVTILTAFMRKFVRDDTGEIEPRAHTTANPITLKAVSTVHKNQILLQKNYYEYLIQIAMGMLQRCFYILIYWLA